MDKIQKVPFVTLTLGLLITVIQILRSLGGSYDEIVLMNLDWLNWEVIYAQPWRILTSPFIHQNVQHYFENLFFFLCSVIRLSGPMGAALCWASSLARL